ncbi:hypothetical protein OEB94_02025 [Streptomyces sp. ICN988]|uniref:hypothetical protein n=1 Tax=Streptomyces sp. ICN988 TaxID=2983765 RepID=UPI0021E3A91D|nr:hypothetical protein [Streptomyces sp. ICN988]MCV2458071.1 hypothetical protein [Streptomyces sp. ICN988]
MRLRSMVAAGVAVLALTAVSGCGDDGGGDEGGAADGWGYGQSAGSGGGDGSWKRASGGYYLLGEDFAVTGGPTTRANLRQSGLLALVCDPKVQIPSGYTKEKALVDGCTLTDFIS